MGMIKTFTGRWVDPIDPDPASLAYEDICHALSMICRFTGHPRVHYSVGTHTLLVRWLVARTSQLPNDLQWATMHDASEAYLNDIASPVKKGMPEYKKVEANFNRVIAERYGLSPEIPQIVHFADECAVLMEARDLFPGSRPEEFQLKDHTAYVWPEPELAPVLRQIFFGGAPVLDPADAVIPKMTERILLQTYPLSRAIIA